MYTSDRVIKAQETGEELVMPSLVKDYTAGLDWAGNSGKLIANLLFKKDALGETFTISSGQGLTWGEIADIYTRLIGTKIKWTSEEEYLDYNPILKEHIGYSWMWNFDRRCNRDMDCSKVLRVTGLSKDDFFSIEEGIKRELEIYKTEN